MRGMTATLALTDDALDSAPPAPPRRADWPLMGDIVSARGGVPEHLIRWRRAEGAPDPAPQT
jgi:hypothetical protein